MDNYVPSRARTYGARRSNIPRQHEFHVAGKEWSSIQLEADASYEYSVFSIKGQVDDKVVTIEYCPTEQMMADYFTKPLQGALFRKLRDWIMGVAPIDLPAPRALPGKASDPRSVLRVRDPNTYYNDGQTVPADRRFRRTDVRTLRWCRMERHGLPFFNLLSSCYFICFSVLWGLYLYS